MKKKNHFTFSFWPTCQNSKHCEMRLFVETLDGRRMTFEVADWTIKDLRLLIEKQEAIPLSQQIRLQFQGVTLQVLGSDFFVFSSTWT
jgi:hypothetical protein